MREYIEKTKEQVKILQSQQYESYNGGKDIMDQKVNPEDSMNPWEEVKQCTIVLKTCIKALELDIQAHKDTIGNQSTWEKIKDGVNDVGKTVGGKLRVLSRKSTKNEEARKMANQTHVGTGKVSCFTDLSQLEYANLVQRDEGQIKKMQNLIDNYDKQE